MRKAVTLLLVVTAVLSLAFTNPEPLRQINVVIDAGHGGNDFGMTIDAHTEKAIVEQITNKIRLLNRNENIVIHLTRTVDHTMTFDQRAAFINAIKPDLVLSLHVNGNKNADASGMEFYVSKENTAYARSHELAGLLDKKFSDANLFTSRGVKEAGFMLLRKSEAPTVLVEMGFLSNAMDRTVLTDESGQNRIAELILEFISELK